VWIERVAIDGFRRLHGTFEFSPGLTVVVGPNEAGKSSLHESLLRALHGFSKPERRRSRGASLRERYAPWDGSRSYGLVARARDGERRYDIEWDFETHTLRVTDERGDDLSAEVVGRGDEVELGRYLLGIGLDDFRQVCCIDQEALLAVAHSSTLTMALQEAVANVAGDVAVEEAVARLEDFLRSTVGARVDTLRPNANGALGRLERERAELRQAIEASDTARAELARISAEAAQLRAQHEDRRTERETIRQRQALSEVALLSARIEEARCLEAAAAIRPQDIRGLDEVAVDAVKAAREQLGEIEARLTGISRDADAAQPEVSRLETEQRDLVALVDGLNLYAGIDISREAEVRGFAAVLAEIALPAAARAELPIRDEALARYRAERTTLLSLTQPPSHPTLRRVGWITLVVITLGVAWAVRRLIRHWRPAQPNALSERLAVYAAASIDELDRRCVDEDAAHARVQALAEARAEQEHAAATRRDEVVASLTAALDAAGAPPAPLQERVAAYLAGCERHDELVKREAELERGRRQLGEAKRAPETADRLRRERDDVTARLRANYAALRIEEDSLDDARARLDELLAASARRRAAIQEADASRKALGSLLGADTLDELVARHRVAAEHHDAHVHEHGVLVERTDDPSKLAVQLASLEESLRHDVGRLAELDTMARALEEEVGDPAVLKERLAAAEEQHAQLLDARDAVGLARDILKESADELSREFAPHLNDALCRNLGRITGGRYEEALVGSDLTVKVVLAGTRKVVSADDLSRATKDQIFLVQRLENCAVARADERPGAALAGRSVRALRLDAARLRPRDPGGDCRGASGDSLLGRPAGRSSRRGVVSSLPGSRTCCPTCSRSRRRSVVSALSTSSAL
jgi:DNA repair protein SbcC/Rad50